MHKKIFRFMYTRPMNGNTPVVRVGCHIKEIVYQKIKVGSLLVSLGSTSFVPLFSVMVTSINLGMFKTKDKMVTGMM